MHVRQLVVVACFATGCASSGARPDGNPTKDTRPASPSLRQGSDQTGAGGERSTVTATLNKLPFNADIVYGVLPLVYDALPILMTTLVASERTIGNTRFQVRRSIGEMPLSRYIDCGGSPGTPNADSYEITMSVVSEVKSDGTPAAILSTLVEATARPASFRGDELRCVTLGTLEKRIAQLARLKIAQIPK